MSRSMAIHQLQAVLGVSVVICPVGIAPKRAEEKGFAPILSALSFPG